MKQSVTHRRLKEGLMKLCYSIAAAIIVFFVLTQLQFGTRLIIAWDVFSICLLAFYWYTFANTDEDKLPQIVSKEDDGVQIVFSIVLLSICISFFGVALLHQMQSIPQATRVFQSVTSLSAIVCSWILLHTVFTTRYADLYFKNEQQTESGTIIPALQFPTPIKPDYLDFAYFSFVIGMTFQVSDVQINSRTLRRFVLLHSLISFVFNTIIVALTINMVVSGGK